MQGRLLLLGSAAHTAAWQRWSTSQRPHANGPWTQLASTAYRPCPHLRHAHATSLLPPQQIQRWALTCWPAHCGGRLCLRQRIGRIPSLCWALWTFWRCGLSKSLTLPVLCMTLVWPCLARRCSRPAGSGPYEGAAIAIPSLSLSTAAQLQQHTHVHAQPMHPCTCAHARMLMHDPASMYLLRAWGQSGPMCPPTRQGAPRQTNHCALAR